MTEMLDTCNNLTRSPAAPGNEVMKEAEMSLTEENLKKDASEIKADDRPVIPAEEETPAVQGNEVLEMEKKVLTEDDTSGKSIESLTVKEMKLKPKAKEKKRLANSNKE